MGGGIRDAIVEVKGDGAYDTLRWETGVHRVQCVARSSDRSDWMGAYQHRRDHRRFQFMQDVVSFLTGRRCFPSAKRLNPLETVTCSRWEDERLRSPDRHVVDESSILIFYGGRWCTVISGCDWEMEEVVSDAD
ncbi:hypothetical protein J3R82DRAFT_1897 [Butyriboletus roseoflavus]|nr:hypothetical protein J3R82DRAFT_1897 [Butyriboletus roseoflavus]